MARNIGRLAYRVEGNWWVCYFAMLESMEGAIEMARIKMPIVPPGERKDAFMALMRECLADILEERIGERPEFWDVEQAPEHERSGRA